LLCPTKLLTEPLATLFVCRAKKHADKLNRLSKYEQSGCRVRIVFMDMITIVARFSPYERVSAVRQFILESIDAGHAPSSSAVLLFRYTASLDKSRDVLTTATVEQVLKSGVIPSALCEIGKEEVLGASGIVPAGTIVAVWPFESTTCQGAYLAPYLLSLLPAGVAAREVRGSSKAKPVPDETNAPPSTTDCCSLS
jgi:hypothetical protein